MNCSGALRSSRTSTHLPGSDCVFNASMRLAGLDASCFQASLVVSAVPNIAAAVPIVVAATNRGAPSQTEVRASYLERGKKKEFITLTRWRPTWVASLPLSPRWTRYECTPPRHRHRPGALAVRTPGNAGFALVTAAVVRRGLRIPRPHQGRQGRLCRLSHVLDAARESACAANGIGWDAWWVEFTPTCVGMRSVVRYVHAGLSISQPRRIYPPRRPRVSAFGSSPLVWGRRGHGRGRATGARGPKRAASDFSASAAECASPMAAVGGCGC